MKMSEALSLIETGKKVRRSSWPPFTVVERKWNDRFGFYDVMRREFIPIKGPDGVTEIQDALCFYFIPSQDDFRALDWIEA